MADPRYFPTVRYAFVSSSSKREGLRGQHNGGDV